MYGLPIMISNCSSGFFTQHFHTFLLQHHKIFEQKTKTQTKLCIQCFAFIIMPTLFVYIFYFSPKLTLTFFNPCATHEFIMAIIILIYFKFPNITLVTTQLWINALFTPFAIFTLLALFTAIFSTRFLQHRTLRIMQRRFTCKRHLNFH